MRSWRIKGYHALFGHLGAIRIRNGTRSLMTLRTTLCIRARGGKAYADRFFHGKDRASTWRAP
jgi:hypothetical protein